MQSWSSSLDQSRVIAKFKQTETRLLIFDLDGTLMSETMQPEPPKQAVKDALRSLCQDARNHVVIASGRSKEQLEEWFNDCAWLHILAEDGYWFGHLDPTDSHEYFNWLCLDETKANDNWKAIAGKLMSIYAKRTQGAVVEENGSCLYWHYTNCELQFGKQQAANLFQQLEDLLITTKWGASLESGDGYQQKNPLKNPHA